MLGAVRVSARSGDRHPWPARRRGEERRDGEAGAAEADAAVLKGLAWPPGRTARAAGKKGAGVDLALRAATLPQTPLQAAGNGESPRPVTGGTVTV